MGSLIRLSILTSPHLFTTFNQVKDHYTTFKRNTSAYNNPGTTCRGILSFGRGGPGRGRGNGGRGGGNDQSHDARKPTQEEIDACTHIKAKRYNTKEYCTFSAAEKAKHWQLMNPTQTPRGAARGGGRGGGGRNGGRRYAYLLDEAHTRKTPSSAKSENSTKRTKYDETTDDGSDLFPEDDESTTWTNQKNKALSRSSPSGRQRKSKE